MSLDVYLHGRSIGGLFPTGEDGYRFVYRPETVEEVGVGKVLLSNSLPVRGEPFGADASRAWVEGLLPQGPRRATIADELGLDPGDGYGLIAELGRDCLGAVTVLRQGEKPQRRDGASPAWLTGEELEELLQPQPERYFDASREQRMRFALPGDRHKLALYRDPASGRWAWPKPGLPSTHIVKPEAPGRPGMVADEHACSLAYRELGLPVVHTAIEEIAGQTCLVSKRFDRWGEGSDVERLHQESFAQALGVTPDASERLSTGTPSLSEASGLLRALGEGSAVETLMKATFCDLLIGCTTLRGGNAGLLFGDGDPMLAPFYGIASTEVYGETRNRPIVIGEDVPPAPLLIDMRHTIELCEVEFQPALIESVKLMGLLCVALNSVAEEAMEAGWHQAVIEEVIQTVIGRVRDFREEAEYLRPPGC
jgi:serine/threonine-protein kinase HipA